MQTIKIFLASSEELAEERIRFGDFIRQLDDTYEVRGYRIKLFKWEDFPSGDDGRPKQEEYNDKVRESDMFVGLFFTKAGAFTLEEYDTAKATQRSLGRPTLYIFCRELEKGQQEEPSLTQFKEKLSNEIRYYWKNYSSSDSLQLYFVMQLLKVENSRWDDLKVENGNVRLGEMEIARMDNLRFASDNKEYQDMSRRLKELPEEIEDARLLANEHPDTERFKDKLQKLLDEREQLRTEFDKQQHLLLNTAIHIIKLQGESLSENRKRAEEAFERGDLQTANFLLKEAERNGDAVFEDFERNAALQAERRKNVHQTIADLLLQATTIMADVSRPIEERIAQVKELYQKADYRAETSGYDKQKYSDLLFDYAQFLNEYGIYKDAEEVILRQIAIAEELFGKEDKITATSYNEIGVLYTNKGDFGNALEYLFKALTIREKVLGKEHPDTAQSYNNIGELYHNSGYYDKALEYYSKALEIREKILGKEHPDTSESYNNIGGVYHKKCIFDKALEFYFKALEIVKEKLGVEHQYTASLYNNIGWVYNCQNDYETALDYYTKAYQILKNKLGEGHPKTKSVRHSIEFVKGRHKSSPDK